MPSAAASTLALAASQESPKISAYLVNSPSEF
jgi:hypothetical protein